MKNPKPKWSSIVLQYFVGSLCLLNSMWLLQLHDYVWAICAALESVVVLGNLLWEVL